MRDAGDALQARTGGARGHVAVCYPADPFGHVPSGIDSFIRGILQWAPPDLDYTLLGATSDPAARPVGTIVEDRIANRPVRCLPLVPLDPGGRRGRVPLTVRYLAALRGHARQGKLAAYDVYDFHRIEPLVILGSDPRPKNVFLHQDMVAIRDPKSDIMWRHAPALYERLESWALSKAENVFCVRESAVRRYAERFARDAGKFRFIPTWYDPQVFGPFPGEEEERTARKRELLQRLGLDPAEDLLTWVGRFDHQKDPLLLIEAMRILRSQGVRCALLMIGEGVLKQEVQGAIRSEGLADVVRLAGARRGVEIAEMLQVSDLYALSSAYEGMPIALLEAQACGVPVVTTDVGEVRRIVVHGVNGRISVSREPAAYADELAQGLRASTAMRGRACTDAVARFRPDLVLSMVHALHREQVARRHT